MPMPAFSRYTWELDGVSFNTGPDADGYAYMVQSSSGWSGSAPRRPDQADRPNGNGAYRGPNYRSARVVTLKGVAQSRTRSGRDELCDRLAGLCRDSTPLYPLVRHEATRSLQLFVELDASVDVTELPDGHTVTFDMQLIANDPRKFATQLQHTDTELAQDPADGVLWNGTPGNTGVEWNGPSTPITGLVYQSTAGTPGLLTMENTGTDSTPIIFTIHGAPANVLVQPTLIEQGTGNTITYGGNLVPGDVLAIDTGTGLVRLNGSAGAGQLSRADLFEIPARSTSTVQFTASGPAPGATASADWRAAF